MVEISERNYRILLLIGGVIVLVLIFWLGKQSFETTFEPVVVPPRTPVRFQPKTNIEKNNVFSSLYAFVTGAVDIGVIGNPQPFDPAAGARLQSGQASSLALMEEVPLGGARVLDMARHSDGSMDVLLFGARTDGGGSYEIRSYDAAGNAATFASWGTSPQDPASLRIASANDGSVWIGGSGGRVARVARGGKPSWIPASASGISGAISGLAVDGAGRVWGTDGVSLSLGGEDAFSSFDFLSRMRSEDRDAFRRTLETLPPDVRISPLPGDDGLVRAGALPARINVLASGEVGLITARTAFIFPLAIQNRMTWIDVSSTIPLAFGPEGDVWGRSPSGELVRIWATGTRAYPFPAPEKAVWNAGLFGSERDRLYALDYVPTSTVLWTDVGGAWTAQIIAASGTVPNDQAVRIDADAFGNIWVMMKQGGLMRIQTKE